MPFIAFAAALLPAFVVPPLSLQPVQRASMPAASVVMQFNLPKIDLGGIEFESFGDKWNAPGDLQLIPSDVQFEDVDGDTITFRGVRNGKVDYYVGKKLKLSGAVLTQSGSSLQVTGTVKKGTPLSFLGFNLEESVTDQMTPKDPEMLEKAMALV